MLLYGDVHIDLDGGERCTHAQPHEDRWNVWWKTMHDTANTSQMHTCATKEEAIEFANTKVGNCGFILVNGTPLT